VLGKLLVAFPLTLPQSYKNRPTLPSPDNVRNDISIIRNITYNIPKGYG
jgi:hypothetical protein